MRKESTAPTGDDDHRGERPDRWSPTPTDLSLQFLRMRERAAFRQQEQQLNENPQDPTALHLRELEQSDLLLSRPSTPGQWNHHPAQTFLEIIDAALELVLDSQDLFEDHENTMMVGRSITNSSP